MYRESIPDNSWRRLKPILLDQGFRGIRKLRIRMEAIVWKLRTGAPWRDLPSELGSWSTNFNFFNRWSKKGVWEQVFKALQDFIDNEWNCIDSTHVKVHAHGHGARGGKLAEQSIGRSRGGNTTKVHARCDGLGNPLQFILTGGNIHDCAQAESLLENCHAQYIMGDKGYDSQPLRASTSERGTTAVIPLRDYGTRAAFFDEFLYKQRHLIENLFQRLKQNRSLATRYDKLSRNFLSLLFIAGALIWLK
jgi:transposase